MSFSCCKDNRRSFFYDGKFPIRKLPLAAKILNHIKKNSNRIPKPFRRSCCVMSFSCRCTPNSTSFFKKVSFKKVIAPGKHFTSYKTETKNFDPHSKTYWEIWKVWSSFPVIARSIQNFSFYNCQISIRGLSMGAKLAKAH